MWPQFHSNVTKGFRVCEWMTQWMLIKNRRSRHLVDNRVTTSRLGYSNIVSRWLKQRKMLMDPKKNPTKENNSFLSFTSTCGSCCSAALAEHTNTQGVKRLCAALNSMLVEQCWNCPKETESFGITTHKRRWFSCNFDDLWNKTEYFNEKLLFYFKWILLFQIQLAATVNAQRRVKGHLTQSGRFWSTKQQ